MYDKNMAKKRIANDLATDLASAGQDKEAKGKLYRVILEFSAAFPGGENAGRALFLMKVFGSERKVGFKDIMRPSWFAISPLLQGVDFVKPPPHVDKKCFELFNSLLTERYLFAQLKRNEIYAIALLRATVPHLEPIYLIHKIWRDEPIKPMIYVSSKTIKCDAARAAFKSAGKDIIWAVADTGVAKHPHFELHQNLELPGGLRHWDFTQGYGEDPALAEKAALEDTAGHGTHVAGIIAGHTLRNGALPDSKLVVKELVIERAVGANEPGAVAEKPDNSVEELYGIAPECKIMSLKVMNQRDDGQTSRLLAAIGYIQLINGYGRHLKVHGLNLSLGYEFDPTCFAAGQSPLSTEVNRLVKNGVVVVAAAGNGGYGRVVTDGGDYVPAAYGSTISDPGNAELAITVGSTHREKPFTFGVSYFSAKGPTADGRMKPDLVAPGERIVSCGLPPAPLVDSADQVAYFKEESGTSMAAPHVSGAVADFLSVRREFQGQPERVKELFLRNATDLGRRPEFQGSGLLDLMRTLQAV